MCVVTCVRRALPSVLGTYSQGCGPEYGSLFAPPPSRLRTRRPCSPADRARWRCTRRPCRAGPGCVVRCLCLIFELPNRPDCTALARGTGAGQGAGQGMGQGAESGAGLWDLPVWHRPRGPGPGRLRCSPRGWSLPCSAFVVAWTESCRRCCLCGTGLRPRPERCRPRLWSSVRRTVRSLGTCPGSGAFVPGLSPAPIVTFPAPANPVDFRHRALRPSTARAIWAQVVSRRALCIPTPSAAVEPGLDNIEPVRFDSLTYACGFRNHRPHRGVQASPLPPAFFLPSSLLRSLSSTGITRRLQSYGRHPVLVACPVPVGRALLPSPSSTAANTPAGPARLSLTSRPVGAPAFQVSTAVRHGRSRTMSPGLERQFAGRVATVPFHGTRSCPYSCRGRRSLHPWPVAVRASPWRADRGGLPSPRAFLGGPVTALPSVPGMRRSGPAPFVPERVFAAPGGAAWSSYGGWLASGLVGLSSWRRTLTGWSCNCPLVAVRPSSGTVVWSLPRSLGEPGDRDGWTLGPARGARLPSSWLAGPESDRVPEP